jgi:hypothetical protein
MPVSRGVFYARFALLTPLGNQRSVRQAPPNCSPWVITPFRILPLAGQEVTEGRLARRCSPRSRCRNRLAVVETGVEYANPVFSPVAAGGPDGADEDPRRVHDDTHLVPTAAAARNAPPRQVGGQHLPGLQRAEGLAAAEHREGPCRSTDDSGMACRRQHLGVAVVTPQSPNAAHGHCSPGAFPASTALRPPAWKPERETLCRRTSDASFTLSGGASGKSKPPGVS